MAKEQTQVLIRKNYDGQLNIQQHETEVLTLESRMALSFMEKWAMVACEIDGEDSAGRSKARRLTASETAKFACDAAQSAMEQFRERGWIKNIPTVQECIDRLKAERKGTKNEDSGPEIV